MSARLIPGLSRCGGTPALNFITDVLSGGGSSTASTAELSWHPSSNYIAIIASSGPTAGVYVYSFNGTTLTQVTYNNIQFGYAYSCNWDTTGNYLCVTYSGSTNAAIIFQWNGTNTLTQVTQIVNTGGGSNNACVGCAWHPSGNFLALTWDSFSASIDRTSIEIYSWNGSNTLALVASGSPSSGLTLGWTFSPVWNPAGTFLAATSQWGYGTYSAQIWAWNGSNSITLADSKSYNYGGGSCGWSRDGRTVFFGVGDPTYTVIALSWNGTNLTQLSYITAVNPDWVGVVSVNACGDYVFVGFSSTTYTPTRIVEFIYKWNSSTNTFTLSSSGSAINTYGAQVVAFSPDNKYVATGLQAYNVTYLKNLRISSTNLFKR